MHILHKIAKKVRAAELPTFCANRRKRCFSGKKIIRPKIPDYLASSPKSKSPKRKKKHSEEKHKKKSLKNKQSTCDDEESNNDESSIEEVNLN